MKKLISVLVAVIGISSVMAHADDASNIRIKIRGALSDNRYFLCSPNVGCLSILDGQRGKTYPVFHAVDMNSLYVMDVHNHFRVSAQNLPSSCNVTVQPNQTITITGSINTGRGNVTVSGLNCSVR